MITNESIPAWHSQNLCDRIWNNVLYQEGNAMELLLIFLIYIIGSFIQGTIGFDFALFVMSFLPLFIPFPKVVLVVLLVNAFMILVRIRSNIFYTGQ